MANQDRIAQRIKNLQKKFGAQSAMRVKDGRDVTAQVKEVLPIGVGALDNYVLGDIGGVANGRITEIFGDEGSGKTSLAYSYLAAFQRFGGIGAIADIEHSHDVTRFRTFGGNSDNLILTQPEHAEMFFDQTRSLLADHHRDDGPLLIVCDSVAALKSKKAMDVKSKAEDKTPAEVAALMARELPKLAPLLPKLRAHILFINQVRDKIGVMFGPTTTTPGGRTLKFYASLRVGLFGGKAIKKKNGQHIGKTITLSAIKTRFSPPFRKARINLIYASGWDNEASVIALAKELGLIKKRKGESESEIYMRSVKALANQSGDDNAMQRILWQRVIDADPLFSGNGAQSALDDSEE